MTFATVAAAQETGTGETPAPVSFLYLPKNRGLAAQVDAIAAGVAPQAARVPLRGEDIPLVMNQIAQRGGSAIGFTGDDLLDNWLASGNKLDERIARTQVAWNDPRAIYGKPALCIIGRKDVSFDPQRSRIAVCSRYRSLAASFLQQTYERSGDDMTSVTGATETLITMDIVDVVIDIVVTGSTIQQLNLEVLEVIYQSDVARLEVRP